MPRLLGLIGVAFLFLLEEPLVVVEGKRQGEHMAQTALRSGTLVPPERALQSQGTEAREWHV